MNKYTKIIIGLSILLALGGLKLTTEKDQAAKEMKFIGYAIGMTPYTEENHDINDSKEIKLFKNIEDEQLKDSPEIIEKFVDYNYDHEAKTKHVDIRIEVPVIGTEQSYITKLYEVRSNGKELNEYIQVTSNFVINFAEYDFAGGVSVTNETIDDEGNKATYRFNVDFISIPEIESVKMYEFDINKKIINTLEDMSSLKNYKLNGEFLVLEIKGKRSDGTTFIEYKVVSQDMIDETYGYTLEYPYTKDLEFQVMRSVLIK